MAVRREQSDCKCLECPDATSVFDVLMQRRPDIGQIDLNCANALTPVPYIDLVNELLEDRVDPDVENLSSMAIDYDRAIPSNLLSWMHRKGFSEVTDQAWVSLDSFGNRIVRDKRIVVLFERDGGDDNCPDWSVRRLRQTHGTAEEVGAAPEYPNQEASKALSDSHSSLKLPFNPNQWEASAYLEKLGTNRADVMQDFATWAQYKEIYAGAYGDIKYATQRLGLTPKDREIIVTEDEDNQNDFWAATAVQKPSVA